MKTQKWVVVVSETLDGETFTTIHDEYQTQEEAETAAVDLAYDLGEGFTGLIEVATEEDAAAVVTE
jgi:hypothetical protein